MLSFVSCMVLILTVICLHIGYDLIKRFTNRYIMSLSKPAGVTVCEKELETLKLSSQGSNTFSALPEALIREICLYLPGNKLHHSIRNVSTELRSVVNALNVKPIGSFIVESKGFGTHVLYAYMKNNKISICGSPLELNRPKGWHPTVHPAYFKAAFKGKFVMNKAEGTFEYQSDKKDWTCIEEPPDQFHNYSICWISPSVLVNIGMMMAYMPSENWTGVACKVQLLNVDTKKPKWHTPPVYRNNPLGPAICRPYLFNTANGTMIMCGGYNDDKDTFDGTYRGVLGEDGDIIQWTELDKMPNKHCFAASFKLKNKIYVIGGMNGDQGMRVAVEWLQNTLVFDLTRETWSKGPKLPFILEFPKAFADLKEEYAFIYGDKPRGESTKYEGRHGSKDHVMLSFNEESGFQKVEDLHQFPLDSSSDWDVVHTIE